MTAKGGLAEERPVAVGDFKPQVPSETPPRGRAHQAPRWGSRIVVFGLAMAGLLLLFSDTFASMVEVWWRSETFAHGFVIGPITLFLIWRRREALRLVHPSTGWLALIPMGMLGALWLLGSAADVIGVQQFATVAMIPALVALICGWRLVRQIAFPLAFLLLAVPIGEALVPPLIKFTAVFTVNALQFTGVPVYWEGARFSIPSGDWSVVKACSGVRYLFATLTVALLFACLNLRSYWRRTVFVALALTLAIFANGLRAYAIVMIGHLSGMRLAVGVDHFIYGWVFFALLMMLIFWIGGYFREGGDGGPQGLPSPSTGLRAEGWSQPVIAALLGLGFLAAFPAWAHYVESQAPSEVVARLDPPNQVAEWTSAASAEDLGWAPKYVEPEAEVTRVYRREGQQVGMYIAYYPVQEQGAELVNYRNVLVAEMARWHVVARGDATVSNGGEQLTVSEARLRSGGEQLLVWHWYWVNGTNTRNPYLVKAYEAVDRLLTGRRRGAGIVFYTPVGRDIAAARATLSDFTGTMLEHVDHMLRVAEGQ